MTNLARFRPISGLFFGGIVFLIAATFVFQAVFNSDIKAFFESLFVGLGASTVAWSIFIRPTVLVFDEGLKITNPLVSVKLSWIQLEKLDTRWALTVYFSGKKLSAWAATAPGRYQGRSLHQSDIRGVALDRSANGILASDNPTTDSGSAANAVRVRWQAAISRQQANFSDQTPEVKLNLVGIYLVAACTLATVACELLIH